MVNRPDLFDAHSLHWHGIPNQGSIFDGLPESAPTVKIGATFPYYYATAGKPGTYFYHCHVEVSEHMQMGMVGALNVLPAQDGNNIGGFTHFAYNDGDGSTGYDVAKTLVIAGFDSNFHEKHIAVQPLPFADMLDDYHALNGRGYPDTINPNALGASAENNNYAAQKHDSVITVGQNQRLLLRIPNISTTHLFTMRVLGIPMKVVGLDAKLLRNGGTDLYYETDSVTIGGGQAVDVLLDTTGVAPGTYFLYTTNLDDLINRDEERGGLMTEIVVTQ
jgi:FtsP/CotA-like multicopper oxidase with cupredoxin domain